MSAHGETIRRPRLQPGQVFFGDVAEGVEEIVVAREDEHVSPEV